MNPPLACDSCGTNVQHNDVKNQNLSWEDPLPTGPSTWWSCPHCGRYYDEAEYPRYEHDAALESLEQHWAKFRR